MTSELTTAAGRALAESLPEDVEMNGGVVNARWLRERIVAIEAEARAAAERDVAAREVVRRVKSARDYLTYYHGAVHVVETDKVLALLEEALEPLANPAAAEPKP